MYGIERPNIFKWILPNDSWPNQEEEENEEKIRRPYVKIKMKAIAKGKRRKRGKAEWNPELYEKLLVKTQLMSDAVRGITWKFHLFEGHIGLVKF
jgi:hypothetical protein